MKTPPDEIDKRIAARVMQARLQAGMLQEELAVALHMSQEQYSKYERGLEKIRASMLWRASQITKISIEWFYGIEKTSTPIPYYTFSVSASLPGRHPIRRFKANDRRANNKSISV